MKDRITSAKIDPATGRPLPAGVKYRAKGQYQARKRIAGGERIRPLTPGAAAPAASPSDTTQIQPARRSRIRHR
ncbi:hypothetical protein [Gluconobacter sphaericus]|uniref:hypothetical protein n=1 Tax=Gluconobacter sphaericus TaxID=574987 RepID=UPI0031FE884C